METVVTDFKMNPQLKELMVNYFHINYEMSATEEELMIEYNELVRTNQLHLLFECERITYFAKNAAKLVE